METKFSRLPPRRCLFLRHKLYFPLSPSPLLLFQFQNSLSLFPPISPDNGLLLIRHQRERRSLVFFPPSFSPPIPFPPFCHFSLTFFDQSPKQISSMCRVQLRKYRAHCGVLYFGDVPRMLRHFFSWRIRRYSFQCPASVRPTAPFLPPTHPLSPCQYVPPLPSPSISEESFFFRVERRERERGKVATDGGHTMDRRKGKANKMQKTPQCLLALTEVRSIVKRRLGSQKCDIFSSPPTSPYFNRKLHYSIRFAKEPEEKQKEKRLRFFDDSWFSATRCAKTCTAVFGSFPHIASLTFLL